MSGRPAYPAVNSRGVTDTDHAATKMEYHGPYLADW